MCVIFGPVIDRDGTPASYRRGWKIVAMKMGYPGIYYSIATGIRYPHDPNEPIPIPTKADRICDNFVNVLNPEEYCHVPNYKGYTAIMPNQKDAISHYITSEENVRPGYILLIINAAVSGDVLIGEYLKGEPVYLGKHIAFSGIPYVLRDNELVGWSNV